MRQTIVATFLIALLAAPAFAGHHHPPPPPPPPPPTAANLTVTTPTNTPVSISLSQGSTGNPTSAALFGAPNGGTVSLSGLMAVFSPCSGMSNYTGGFDYQLFNSAGGSNVATVTVNVH